MSFRLRCERLMVYAEIRPCDGTWTLAGGRNYATPFRTREEALAALPAVVEHCGDGWKVVAEDFQITADEGLPMPMDEQAKRYVKKFFAETDVA